jgi:hypothetical protein
LIFKYDPSTIAFIVCVLDFFGLSQFKIDELEGERPKLNNKDLEHSFKSHTVSKESQTSIINSA